MKTLILGMGNPILCDDAVGILVAKALGERLSGDEVTVMESSAGGLGLLDLLAGYERAIIIDSIKTKDGEPGSLYRLGMADLPPTSRLMGPHDVDLTTALKMGEALGMALPSEVRIYAIEVEDPYTFGEELTPKVEAALPNIIDLIAREEFNIA